MASHWLLVMIFVMNGYGTAKYIEFPTKLACEAAAATLKEKTRADAACVEGGKPIPESKGFSDPGK
jgi:hypothetical protein